jgi:hypothetical protein
VFEARASLDLTLESLASVWIIKQPRRENLQRDMTTQREILGEVHDAHPTFADCALDVVVAEVASG